MNGSYMLIIYLGRNINIPIGRLGYRLFRSGYYIYVGSAFNGLIQRVLRHYRVSDGLSKVSRWHIDYLLKENTARICFGVGFINQDIECDLSRYLLDFGASPIEGFGSTDCRCVSHLYHIDRLSVLKTLKSIFKKFCIPGRCILV